MELKAQFGSILKPLGIWHLEHQFDIIFSKEHCPHCKKLGFLRFNKFLPPRHVHGLERNCYFTCPEYICTKLGCKKTFTVMDKGLDINLIPNEVAL